VSEAFAPDRGDEMFDQRGLADARLAADEHDLAAPFAAALEVGVEMRELTLATDELCARDRRRGRVGGEAISTAANSFEEPRRGGIVAKRRPHLADADPHHAGADAQPRPHRREQLIAGDQPAGVLNQVAQNGERLVAQRHVPLAAMQMPGDAVEPELAEAERVRVASDSGRGHQC
jgi:hypothetical protein